MAEEAAQQLADVEQELYAVPPADFVRVRDELAVQARDAGDGVLAKQISALRKPTAGAWLANLLAREHPDQVSELVALGAALRDAQAGLDATQLRELGQQRHRVVAALVGLARRTAAEQGHPAGAAAAEDLEATLTAALADPAAADALLAGRLVHGLTYAGLGQGASAQSRAAGGPARPTTGTAGRGGHAGTAAAAAAEPKQSAAAVRAAKVDAAERELAQARMQAAAAQAEAAAAEQAAAAAMQVLRAARTEVDRLRGELTAAERDVARREAERETAVREKVRTARASSGAAKEAESAAKALQKLVAG